jgi:hypothetical protein
VNRIDGALVAASVMHVRLNDGLFFDAVETFLIGGGESPSEKTFPNHVSWRKSFRNSFGPAGMPFARIGH